MGFQRVTAGRLEEQSLEIFSVLCFIDRSERLSLITSHYGQNPQFKLFSVVKGRRAEVSLEPTGSLLPVV